MEGSALEQLENDTPAQDVDAFYMLAIQASIEVCKEVGKKCPGLVVKGNGADCPYKNPSRIRARCVNWNNGGKGCKVGD